MKKKDEEIATEEEIREVQRQLNEAVKDPNLTIIDNFWFEFDFLKNENNCK
jgi:hypothetical protein